MNLRKRLGDYEFGVALGLGGGWLLHATGGSHGEYLKLAALLVAMNVAHALAHRFIDRRSSTKGERNGDR